MVSLAHFHNCKCCSPARAIYGLFIPTVQKVIVLPRATFSGFPLSIYHFLSLSRSRFLSVSHMNYSCFYSLTDHVSQSLNVLSAHFSSLKAQMEAANKMCTFFILYMVI